MDTSPVVKVKWQNARRVGGAPRVMENTVRPMQEPWQHPDIQRWCQLLLDSYRRWTDRDLIDRHGTSSDQAQALFHAPFVVVSHGAEEDPLLNFGNLVALDLWEASWEDFRRTPSRLTTEPVNRQERERMLLQAARHGMINDYRGVRISTKGRRFLVEQATVWNVMDPSDRKQGQAATFSRWTYLSERYQAPD